MANQVFRGSYTIVMVFRAKLSKIFRFFSTKEVELDLDKFWDLEKLLRTFFFVEIWPCEGGKSIFSRFLYESYGF